MKVWITRAQPGARRTAEAVRALGLEPCVHPLLAVKAIAGPVDLDGAGALAFTSANGVRAFAERNPDRGLPVFSVGDATATAAFGAGFRSVSSADGDVQALARLIAGAQDRIAGRVLLLGALEPAGDLAGLLKAQGVSVRAQPLYDTVDLDPPGVADLLPQLGAVLLHSPKGARRFAAVTAGLDLGGLAAGCISPAAAAPLAGLGLKAVRTAAQPNEASLLQTLKS